MGGNSQVLANSKALPAKLAFPPTGSTETSFSTFLDQLVGCMLAFKGF